MDGGFVLQMWSPPCMYISTIEHIKYKLNIHSSNQIHIQKIQLLWRFILGINCRFRGRSFWKIVHRYIFEEKVLLQIISSTQNLLSDRAKIFLSWACQRYRADFNYLSHFFPFCIFVPLADQLGQLGATWKTDVDICECQWVGDNLPGWSLAFSSHLSLKCKLDSDLVVLLIVNTNGVSN